MKQEAIKELSVAQLDDQLIIECKNHMDLRFQHAAGQLENVAALRKIKRTIARIKTEMRVRTKKEETADA